MESTRDDRVYMEPALSPGEAAVRLGCSRGKVYDLLDSGELTGFRIGSARRIRPEDLQAYIRRHIEHGE